MGKINASLVAVFAGLTFSASAQVTTTNFNLATPTIQVFNDRIGNSRLFSGPNTDRVRISSFQSPSPDSDVFIATNAAGQQFLSTNGGATTVAVTHADFGTLLPNPRPLGFVGLTSGNGGGRNEYTTTFNRASPAVAPLLDLWAASPFTVIASNPLAANGITAIETTAPAFDKNAMPPFVTDLRVTGGLTPTLTWLIPAGSTPQAVTILVRRVEAENADGSRITRSTLVHVKTLPATATSYTFGEEFSNAALPGFPTGLETGRKYEINVNLDLRSGGQLKGRARTFVEFTPLTTTSSNVAVFLPSVGPNGAFTFDVTVNATDTYPIDPVIAVGYIYEVGASDPNFRSVSLPDIGDGRYSIDVFDPGLGQYRPGVAAGANNTYDFTAMGYPLGVAKFRVKGIEASAGLDASNTTAFVTTVGFMGVGRFTGTMVPISGYDVAGFLPPVNLPPTVNTSKAGATLPLKWALSDKQGYAVTDLTAVSAISYKPTSCAAFATDAAGAASALGAGGSRLRYDLSSSHYVFNWKTPAAPGCYSLFVTLDTAEMLQANVMLTQ